MHSETVQPDYISMLHYLHNVTAATVTGYYFPDMLYTTLLPYYNLHKSCEI